MSEWVYNEWSWQWVSKSEKEMCFLTYWLMKFGQSAEIFPNKHFTTDLIERCCSWDKWSEWWTSTVCMLGFGKSIMEKPDSVFSSSHVPDFNRQIILHAWKFLLLNSVKWALCNAWNISPTSCVQKGSVWLPPPLLCLCSQRICSFQSMWSNLPHFSPLWLPTQKEVMDDKDEPSGFLGLADWDYCSCLA